MPELSDAVRQWRDLAPSTKGRAFAAEVATSLDCDGVSRSMPTFGVPLERENQLPPFVRLLAVLEVLDDVCAFGSSLAGHLVFHFGEIGVLAANLDLNSPAWLGWGLNN